MKRFRVLIRRFRRKLAYMLLGYTPIDHEAEREANIKYLFKAVYAWDCDVRDKYDEYYKIYHDDTKAKEKVLEFYCQPNILPC